jgi:transaldolase
MTALAEAGIDMADVVQVLEDEGVEKFETSWNELLESTQAELTRLAGDAQGSE